MEDEDWLTVPEAARYSGVSDSTLRNYYRRGKLPGEVRGRHLFLRRAHLEVAHQAEVMWDAYRSLQAEARDAWDRWIDHVLHCPRRRRCQVAYLIHGYRERAMWDPDPDWAEDAAGYLHAEGRPRPPADQLPRMADELVWSLVLRTMCRHGRRLYLEWQRTEAGTPPLRPPYPTDVLSRWLETARNE